MTGVGAAAALRRLATGLYVLGVREVDGAAYASTVSWVIPVSFEPPMLAVALQPQSRTLGLVQQAGTFAIGVLDPSDVATRADAAKLGRASVEVANKRAGVGLDETTGGLPILSGVRAWVECRWVREQRNGDHVLVIAEVIAGWEIPGLPPPVWSYWGC